MKVDYSSKVCIAGLGPAGIGAALILSTSHLASRVLCLDAGTSMDGRSCSVLQNGSCKREEPCSMISGLGGSSLLGGHKISTFPAGSGLGTIMSSPELANKKLTHALNIFKNYILLQKPNIPNNSIKNGRELFKKLGFDFRYYDSYICSQEDLRNAYQTMFLQIQSAGISILPNTKVIQIVSEDNGFKLIAKQDNYEVTIVTKYLVLGVGRLGRNLLKSLNTKWNLCGRENHLEVGVRLEFPTDLYPDINKYHNDIKLLFNDTRTFCVCKDGKIAPYRFEDIFLIDGYYNTTYKTGFTNLAIMVRLKPSDQNEAIFSEIKRRVVGISNGMPVRQILTDYLNLKTENNNLPKYSKGSISLWVWGDVNQCFPRPISTKIKEGVHDFVSKLIPEDHWEKVSVFAPAVEYSWLSFPIKSDFSIIPRLYLIGDCTGRFRGILQAFCSGIICAENIIGDYHERNPRK